MSDDEKKLSLEEIKARRKRSQKNKSMALARKFEGELRISEEDDGDKNLFTREQLIEALVYDPENISDTKTYTEEELEYVKKSMKKLLLGSGSSIIMKCPGKEECPYGEECPFARIGKEPMGKSCLLETMYFNELLIQTVNSFDVDATNVAEMAFCNELVESKILQMRANRALGKPENVDLVVMQESFSKSGDLIQNPVVSPHLDARDKIVRRIERIIKLMVGDRQEKYKRAAALKKRDETDESTDQAKKARMIMEAKMKKEVKELESAEEEEEVLTPDDILSQVEDPE